MRASDVVRGLFEGYERDGAEGGRRYFDAFDGAIDDVRFDLAEIHHDSPEAVIAVVTLSGVGAATRIPVEQYVPMSFTTRDGLVTRIMSHPSLDAALAEVGVTPE